MATNERKGSPPRVRVSMDTEDEDFHPWLKQEQFQGFMVWADSQPNILSPDREELPELACISSDGSRYLRRELE